MPLNGLASVSLLSTLANGQMCANTFHIANLGAGAPPPPADLAILADDIDAFMTTAYRAVLKSTAMFNGIKVAQVPNPLVPGDPYADFIKPMALAGTRVVADEVGPNQACLCVSLKTNSGQRSYRGHLLLPPSQHARDMSGNLWDHASAYYLNSVAFAVKLQAGCAGTHTWTGTKLPTYNLSIYSRTLETRSIASVSGVITVVAGDAIHWLRSRARGTT